MVTAGDPTPNRCTTWFTGKRLDGTPRGVTDGHCNAEGANVDPNDHAVIGNDDLGAPGGNTYANGTDSDAVRIAITSADLTNRINTGTNLHRTVKAPRYQMADLDVLNKDICFNGVTSQGCGLLVRRDFSSIDTNGITQDHLYEIDQPSVGGTSGAPVYGVRTNDGTARVAGMVEGSNNDNGHMVFHAAGYVLNDLGMCIYYETTPCEN